MNHQHQKLAAGAWGDLGFAEQMANIGSEVERTIKCKEKGNVDFSRRAFERALELLDLTLADGRNIARLKELARLREMLADRYFFENTYQSSDEDWRKYFFSFNFAARANT